MTELMSRPTPDSDLMIEVTVTDRVDVASGVITLTFAAKDAAPLPDWQPGAHIDVHLGNGLIRQYSLCGPADERHSYTIGVLNSLDSRGGSRYIHDSFRIGDIVTISAPRNHFPLVDAERYLFVAGGIGITPIASMVREVSSAGKQWSLIYGGRSAESMAFTAELAEFADHVTLWPQDSHGLIDLPTVLGTPDSTTAIYACGPEPLLAAIETHCTATWKPGTLHLERFTPPEIDTSGDTAFEIELAQTGTTLTVAADTTVLDVLADAGIHILSSCREGTCGTCETPVLDGVVDHRDSVLTEEEQNADDCMMVCVSRARCSRLVLDV